MDSSLMAKGMVLGLRSLGVQIDKLTEDENGTILYFSVPKSSHNRNAHGEEMAGSVLAKRVKETFTMMGVTFSICKYKIRDEDWTIEKDNAVFKRR